MFDDIGMGPFGLYVIIFLCIFALVCARVFIGAFFGFIFAGRRGVAAALNVDKKEITLWNIVKMIFMLPLIIAAFLLPVFIALKISS